MSAPTLSVDFETRATVDLRKSGVYPYAQHEYTDIWCMAFCFGDEEEVDLWHPGLPIPARIGEHVVAGHEIRAWNAAFERIIWREILTPRYGFPEPALEQYVCTAAEAAAMALPRSLDGCAAAVGVTEQKDAQGYLLMMRMTRPRYWKKPDPPVWWDLPDRKERLYAYCKQDVRVERTLASRLRRLSPKERDVYLLDQRINDRGVLLDLKLIQALKSIANEGIERAGAALNDLTDGAVTSPTQAAKLRAWLASEGVETESVGKAATRDLLESDLTDKTRTALEIRAEAAKSSVAKLDAMQKCACDDDRARGLLLYHAAGTGRWGGRLIQPQNFPRPSVADPEQFIPDVLADRYDHIDFFAHPLSVASSLLRGCLVAAPGHRFVVADYAAIEARVLNWIAGEASVCDNFRLYDAGDKSRDVYKIMAVAMGLAQTTADVTKQDRQAGKAAELGCGYGMGWKKFIDAAWDVYGVRVTEEQSQAAVNAYRGSHPNVVRFWYELNDAAMAAVADPGSIHMVGRHVRFTQRGSYLWLILPSGRPLAYARPSIKERETPWGEMKPAVEVYGVNSFTRQWEPYSLYGGIFAENVVQAVARDLLAEAMLRVESVGYTVVLNVHDEIVSEVREDFGSVSEFEKLISAPPEWAAGCPIAAEGWEGTRYGK